MKFLYAFILTCSTCFAGLTVTPIDTLGEWAGSLLGDGVAISNIVYTGDLDASGYFTGGNSAGLYMDEGIIMTTGLASDAENDNNEADMTTELYMVGDSDLDSLITEAITYDASVLEFDFTTTGTTAYFNFAFASEEYIEYVDTDFNDVFGFFIDGVNYATIPGEGDTPVAINTINHLRQSDHFNDNDPWHSSGGGFDMPYDGFTDVLTTRLTGLDPATSYSLKIAIGDAGDLLYDSALFIQAGSFSETAVSPTPEPGEWLMIFMGIGFILFLKKGEIITLLRKRQ